MEGGGQGRKGGGIDSKIDSDSIFVHIVNC